MDKCREAFEGKYTVPGTTKWTGNHYATWTVGDQEAHDEAFEFNEKWQQFRNGYKAALSQPDPVREQLVEALKNINGIMKDTNYTSTGELLYDISVEVDKALTPAGASVEGE